MDNKYFVTLSDGYCSFLYNGDSCDGKIKLHKIAIFTSKVLNKMYENPF